MSVGAEIVGLRAGSEQRPGVRARLYQAWLDHGILLFRDVDSTERHLALSQCFGELEIHPVPEVRSVESPYLIEIGVPPGAGRPAPPAHVFDGTDLRINRIAWHRDTAYTPDICKGAMLRMVRIPEHAGETLLADTARAWDDLPDALRSELEDLEYRATVRTDHMSTRGRPGTFWKTVRPATPGEHPDGVGRVDPASDIDSRYPSVVQPAVLKHPESGRRCIFLSPTYVDGFLGMEPAEGDALLCRLVDHMLQPEYVYRHRWSVNDAILWDNRRFMHAGAGNLPTEPRYGLRTTLAGALRTGRYLEQDAG